MRLNGWQRLWVVLSVFWIIGRGIVALQLTRDDYIVIIVVGLVPPALLYILGLLALWIWRGFRPAK